MSYENGFYYAQFDKQAVNAVLDQLTPASLKVWYISQQEQTDSKLHFYDGEYRLADFSKEELAAWQQTPTTALNLPAVNRLLPENFTIKTNMSPAIVTNKSKNNGPDTADSGNNTIKYNKSG